MNENTLNETDSYRAMLIAMAVRNAMEELHGGGIEDSLTDAQMAKLNPIIRNSIATTLHAFRHAERDSRWQSVPVVPGNAGSGLLGAAGAPARRPAEG